MKRWFSALLAVALLGAVVPAFGIGLIVVPEQEHWHPPAPRPILPPHPLPPHWTPPPQPHPFAPLELRSVKVHTRIRDQVAVTSVEQEFYNANAARLEGTFLFPFPKNARIDKFTMEIDGKMAEAELLPADKARGLYEDIVRKMRDPALLEYAGCDVFKVRIFPIEPNSRKRIALSYSQLLPADNGLVSYALPLGTQKYSAQPVRNLSVKVELETKRPLKTIYSPIHHVEVRRDGAHRATAGFESAEVQPDADFQLYFAAEKEEIGLSLLASRTAGQDGYFLLLATPEFESRNQPVMLKDVAFVLDTSGSMAGKKLDQAKKALQFCVANLNDGDRFEIIRFSSEAEPLFQRLTEANRASRTKAEAFIQDLRPIGGTAIDDALRQALALRPGRDASSAGDKPASDRPFVVIFLTDGKPTIGHTDEKQILEGVRRDAGPTRVFCFGIGTDVNTHLLDKITEATRAVSQYVLPEEDLEVKVSSFFNRIREPVLANPTLAFTGGIRVTKLHPSPLPDFFRGDQLVLVGRYRGEGDAAVVLEGTVNGVARKFTFETTFPASSSAHEFIPRLWATRRVGFLLDEIRLRGESAELRDEVTALAREHGIVTPYTAYLILEDEGRRNVPLAMQTLQDFSKDRPAQEMAGTAYRSLKASSSGEAGVSGARFGIAMRQAEVLSDLGDKAKAESHRNLVAATPPASASAPGRPAAADMESISRLEGYLQQTRFVNGRNFYQNGRQWQDALVAQNQNARRVRILFNSPEYFELIRRQPQARPWLALGQNVQFVLEGVLYDVYDKES